MEVLFKSFSRGQRLYISMLIFLSMYSELAGQITDLNTSFSNQGIFTFSASTASDVFRSVISLPDESVIAVGYTTEGSVNQMLVVKVDQYGRLADDFGVGGKAVVRFPINGIASGSTLTQDGKIVIVGHTWNGKRNVFACARLHTNGTLDSDFGDQGLVQVSIGYDRSVATAMGIQQDGKIVLGGYAGKENNGNDDFALVRLTSEGQPDASFGVNGMVTTSFGVNSRSWINDLAIGDDNSIVAVGFKSAEIAMARYSSDGVLDQRFGSAGKLHQLIANRTLSILKTVAILHDESIVAGGFAMAEFQDFLLIKLHSTGAFDSTFGENGIEIDTISSVNDGILTLYADADKITVAGNALSDEGIEWVVKTYDTSRGIPTHENSLLTSGYLQPFGLMYDMAFSTDGRYFLAGSIGEENTDACLLSLGESLPLHFSKPALQYYPNPASDIMVISGFTSTSAVELTICDLAGRIHFRDQRRPASDGRLTFDVSSLSTNTYVLTAFFDNREEVFRLLVR